MKTGTTTSFGLILVLWFAGLAAAAQFAKISVIFPSLRGIYPDAGASLGFLLSLISFLGIALGVIAGLIVARVGFRRMLLLALVLGALVSAYQATLPAFSLMLASRVLEGLSHLAIVVAAPTLIAQVSADRHRAAAMTLWGTFFGVAFALVAWLGLPLAEAYGPASLFAAHAAITGAIAMGLAIMLPKSIISNTEAMPLGLTEIFCHHIEIYSSPHIAAPALGWGFYTVTFVSLLTVLPDFVAPEYRVLVSGAMPLASIASSMTIGVLLLRYITAVKVIELGFALAVIVALLLWTSPSSPLLCIALFAALGLVQGASFAAVPQLNESVESRAYANGGLAQMGNLGNGTGTPLLLAIIAWAGFGGLIVSIVVCYTLGLLTHLYLERARARKAG